MKAVVEIAGKQYSVEEGDVVYVDRIQGEAGETIMFDNVLLVSEGENLKVGTPAVDGASVVATVLKHGKAKKIIVFKYKAKKNYRRKKGHRRFYTMVKIEKISA